MGDSGLDRGTSNTPVLEVKEVLFDFEGTLVDFQWQLQAAIEECLSALEDAGFNRQWYGVNPTYPVLYNETPDLSRKVDVIDDPRSGIAIIDSVYDKYDADAMARWNLYPDTLETMTKLKSLGFQLGLVSNVGAAALRPTLNRLGLSDYFSVIISRNEVNRLKPDPEGLLKAAAHLGVEPADVIMVGDSLDDVGAARSAGMQACYLSGGQDSRDTMRQKPADIEITRLSQLPEFLNRLR